MKDVVEIRPDTKSEGLSKFAAQGYLVIDATYTPVNYKHLTSRQRNELIMDNFSLLVEDLRKHTEADTGVVLVKANICEILELPLTNNGFKVLNQGKTIPFPSTGQQARFRTAVRPILGL